MVIAYLSMIKPVKALIPLIAVFFGGLLVIGWDFQHLSGYSPLYPALLAVFLIAGGGNIINDYFDAESDRINHPKRPIPSGKASRRGALVLSAMFFLAGVLFAAFINWPAFIIAVVNSLLLALYSSQLQNKIYTGNILIGYLIGSSILFGGIAMNNVVLPIWLGLLLGLSVISREMIKDLEDAEGDRKSILKRLASKFRKASTPITEKFGIPSKSVEVKVNKRITILLSAVSLMAAVVISPMPYIFGVLGFNYLMAIIPADIVLFFTVYQLNNINGKANYRTVQKMIKLGILLTLIAFIVAIWF
ncbi:MAG: UbiA family prenyltransferase [Nanoarchaeota archaeon]